MNSSFSIKISPRIKILALGLVWPLLFHHPAWGQEGCSKADIQAEIRKWDISSSYQVPKSVVNCKEKSIQPLIDLLVGDQKDDNADVRSRAASALGKIGDNSPETVEALRTVLTGKNRDDNADVRSRAASALGEIGDKSSETVEALRTVLTGENRDDNADVRWRAADALGKIGDNSPETVEALRTVLTGENRDDDAFVHRSAADALGRIGSQLEKIRTNKIQLSTEDLGNFIKEFKTTLKALESDKESFNEKQISDIKGTIDLLNQEKRSRQNQSIAFKLLYVALTHSGLWLVLVFLYPKYPFIQAIFFWNPKVRKWVGLWYVDLALIWIPFLRSRLFAPFKDSLLADAHLDSFDPSAYFPNSHVKQKIGNNNSKPIPEVIPEIKGQLIIEGESGLGKSMFLRDLAKKSQRIVVYLPAKKCDQGVLEGIKNKLHGHVKEDPNFLKNLIYSGAIDICIDGLNEVTPDTRATITHFVESYFKGNIIMATQPLEWIPPSTAKTYILQPLQENQIEDFLCSRTTILPEDSFLKGQEYEQACRNYLIKNLAQQQSNEEQIAIRRMLSNPMELTIIAQMLAENKSPNLLKLQQEQYEMMAKDYDEVYPVKKFPLKEFSEAVYQMRLNDQYTITAENWQEELKCMERYKMVISRQIKKENKTEIEWYFRHDKIQDFFIVQTFLEPENEHRLLDHISDSRFRGVYFLLATMMPLDAAKKLREDLIQYAADTKDHTVSDTFIQLFRNRKLAYV